MAAVKNARNLPDKILAEHLPDQISQYITPPPKITVQNSPEGSRPKLSFGEKIAGTRFDRTKKDAASLAEDRECLVKLRLKISIFNQINPELRLTMPQSYIGLDVEMCREYYWKWQSKRFEKDAANKIASLLISFLCEHPLEWGFCGWKNDAITELVLGELNSSPNMVKDRKAIALRWLKEYWQRERESERETETYLGPTRMAASEAVFELQMLELADKPQPWMHPTYSDYVAVVRWLNRRWVGLAAKKKGAALLDTVASEFGCEHPKTELSVIDFPSASITCLTRNAPH